MAEMTCSFTGHRVIPHAHKAALTELLDRGISYAYKEGCRTFCLGGALGFDTLAAERVIAFRLSHADVSLSLILPCKDQAGKWDGADVTRYREILLAADSVEYIAEYYTDSCMRERNQALVDRADMVIGYVGRARSGAAQTMRMAQRRGIPFYNLYPDTVKAREG